MVSQYATPLNGSTVTGTSSESEALSLALADALRDGAVKTIVVDYRTTEVEPDALLVFATKHPKLAGTDTYRLSPTADGGTHLDYTIHFDAPVPGVATAVAKVLTQKINANLPKLVP